MIAISPISNSSSLGTFSQQNSASTVSPPDPIAANSALSSSSTPSPALANSTPAVSSTPPPSPPVSTVLPATTPAEPPTSSQEPALAYPRYMTDDTTGTLIMQLQGPSKGGDGMKIPDAATLRAREEAFRQTVLQQGTMDPQQA
jgi:hypothetical protein